MLAALLVSVGKQFVTDKGMALNGLSKEELLELHRKYKHLIKWFTKKSKLSEIYSESEIDKLIENEELIKLRNLLQIEDEETLIFIIIAANV